MKISEATKKLPNMQTSAETFSSKYEEITEANVMEILKKEVGEVFVHVLEDAGVYKCTEEGRKAFLKFVETLGV